MKTKCIVPGCTTTALKTPIRQFCFPRNPKTREKWIVNLQVHWLRDFTYNQIHSRGLRVCALHFEDNQFQNETKLKLLSRCKELVPPPISNNTNDSQINLDKEDVQVTTLESNSNNTDEDHRLSPIFLSCDDDSISLSFDKEDVQVTTLESNSNNIDEDHRLSPIFLSCDDDDSISLSFVDENHMENTEITSENLSETSDNTEYFNITTTTPTTTSIQCSDENEPCPLDIDLEMAVEDIDNIQYNLTDIMSNEKLSKDRNFEEFSNNLPQFKSSMTDASFDLNCYETLPTENFDNFHFNNDSNSNCKILSYRNLENINQPQEEEEEQQQQHHQQQKQKSSSTSSSKLRKRGRPPRNKINHCDADGKVGKISFIYIADYRLKTWSRLTARRNKLITKKDLIRIPVKAISTVFPNVIKSKLCSRKSSAKSKRIRNELPDLMERQQRLHKHYSNTTVSLQLLPSPLSPLTDELPSLHLELDMTNVILPSDNWSYCRVRTGNDDVHTFSEMVYSQYLQTTILCRKLTISNSNRQLTFYYQQNMNYTNILLDEYKTLPPVNEYLISEILMKISKLRICSYGPRLKDHTVVRSARKDYVCSVWRGLKCKIFLERNEFCEFCNNTKHRALKIKKHQFYERQILNV